MMLRRRTILSMSGRATATLLHLGKNKSKRPAVCLFAIFSLWQLWASAFQVDTVAPNIFLFISLLVFCILPLSFLLTINEESCSTTKFARFFLEAIGFYLAVTDFVALIAVGLVAIVTSCFFEAAYGNILFASFLFLVTSLSVAISLACCLQVEKCLLHADDLMLATVEMTL